MHQRTTVENVGHRKPYDGAGPLTHPEGDGPNGHRKAYSRIDNALPGRIHGQAEKDSTPWQMKSVNHRKRSKNPTLIGAHTHTVSRQSPINLGSSSTTEGRCKVLLST